jgi:hypothetical protein
MASTPGALFFFAGAARPPISTDPARHVLHDIERPER